MSSERMAKSLDLSEDQTSQIYEITLKYAQERQAKAEEMKAERKQKAEECEQSGEKCEKERPQRGERGGERGRNPQMAQGRGDQPRGGDQMSEQRKAQMKEIIAVLNVDQIVEFIEIQNRRGNQPQQGRPGGRGRGAEHRQPPHHGGHGAPGGQGRPGGEGRPERAPRAPQGGEME